jgi:hypothetical protein
LWESLVSIEKQAQDEYDANMARKRPIRVGNMLTQNIYSVLSRYPLMTLNEYSNIDEFDLATYYQYYMDFIARYSLFEVATTKQLFCAYMRITVSKFNTLIEQSNDERLKEYAEYINDNINGLIYSSAETGNCDSKSALTRGKIKKDGQNMVEIREEVNVNVTQTESPEQLMAKAQKIFQLASKK